MQMGILSDFRLLLVFYLFWVLGACVDENLPTGVIATVNGEPITLHAVQNLLDSRSAGLGLQSDTTFEEIRRNYGKGLAVLIANTLVRQELESRGIAPSEQDLDLAIERISSDYGEQSLEDTLEDNALRLEDWRQLMRDHLALEVFRNQILLPTIKIEYQEIKNYYQDHKKDFILPETVRVCFLSASQREEIQDWCSKIKNHDFLDDSVAQCVEVTLKEIPQPWNREIKNLKPMNCGIIRDEEGEWQSVALLEKRPERLPELSEVYPLVEKILLEPRQTAAFEQWLEHKSATARVLVAPGMREALFEHQEGKTRHSADKQFNRKK